LFYFKVFAIGIGHVDKLVPLTSRQKNGGPKTPVSLAVMTTV